MIFSSLEFIFRFMPCFLIIYYLMPHQIRNIVLLSGSILFYAIGEPRYVPLILVSAAINYVVALRVEKETDSIKRKKAWLGLGLAFDLGMLFYFKYTNFFLEGVAAISHHTVKVPVVNSVLPLGISFYTFTSVAYLVDVYRGDIKAERSKVRFGTFFCMFPQLLSGPIVRYSEIRDSLRERRNTMSRLESGLKIFTIGLGYKVILANQLATMWNSIQTIGFESISTPLAWLSVIGYSLQIYFDFNGYSLMAIGIGEMLGFSLPVNFAHPYMSRSVGEFWRRWHITLGSWFKTYVYIPLGGNRCSKLRQVFNLFVVWLLTGLWHGASLNFVLWGGYLFVFITLEKLLLEKWLARNKVISRVYLLLVIGISWMLFAITDLHEIGMFLTRLFPFLPSSGGIAVNHSDFIKQISSYGVLILLGVFLSTPLPMRWYIRYKNRAVCIFGLLGVFWFSIYLIALGNNNPFLYFRF